MQVLDSILELDLKLLMSFGRYEIPKQSGARIL